jgi:hypothetical protein
VIFELALQVTSYLRPVDLRALVRTSHHEFDCVQDILYDLAVTHRCKVGTLLMTVPQWATLNIHYRKRTFPAVLQKEVDIQLGGSLEAKLLGGKDAMGCEDGVRASHCNDQDLAQDMLSWETGGSSVRDALELDETSWDGIEGQSRESSMMRSRHSMLTSLI